MAEEFRLKERLGQRTSINCDERPAASAAVGMDGAGDQLLSGPTLSLDEHRAVRLRDSGNHFVDCNHSATTAHEVVEPVSVTQLAA